MNHKILICDDQENTRESVKSILGDRYDLFLVDSPEQALYTLENSKNIKAVLLNTHMSQSSSQDLIDQIKNKHKTILVAGYVKPLKKQEILETVRKCVEPAL